MSLDLLIYGLLLISFISSAISLSVAVATLVSSMWDEPIRRLDEALKSLDEASKSLDRAMRGE